MMTTGVRAGAWCAVVTLALAAGGCSFVDSSQSISKSISSPFESSSKSSSPEDELANGIRDFTYAHVRSGGSAADLKARVGELAEKGGVSDWENSSRVWEAVGAGIRKSGYNETELSAYVGNLAPSSDQYKWIQQGYKAYKPAD